MTQKYTTHCFRMQLRRYVLSTDVWNSLFILLLFFFRQFLCAFRYFLADLLVNDVRSENGRQKCGKCGKSSIRAVRLRKRKEAHRNWLVSKCPVFWQLRWETQHPSVDKNHNNLHWNSIKLGYVGEFEKKLRIEVFGVYTSVRHRMLEWMI